MTKTRADLLERLARHINSIQLDHPTRVAIDGVDTSGKTSLANELIEPLSNLGRPVIRGSIDGFHRPKSERYARGKDSPKGYYLDSFDHKLLTEKLLVPLESNLPYMTAVFDYKTDSLLPAAPEVAAPNSVLLFDGVFLLRPELNNYWDLRIFLDVPFDEVLRRALVRDADVMGQEVKSRYLTRYIPGQKLYLESVQPHEIADIVINNSDIDQPVFLKV